jgi:hypothetical protein
MDSYKELFRHNFRPAPPSDDPVRDQIDTWRAQLRANVSSRARPIRQVCRPAVSQRVGNPRAASNAGTRP